MTMGPSAAEAAVPATATAAIKSTVQRSIVSSESRENIMPVFGGTGVNEILQILDLVAVAKPASPPSLRAQAKQSRAEQTTLDCFVAEPVIGRAFARPVGSSQCGLN